MEAKFQIFLILLAVLAGTALMARRINVAPPAWKAGRPTT